MLLIVCVHHLDREERAGCFALFVFLVSRDCCVTLPHDATVGLQFVIVVFPDNTHYVWCDFYIITTAEPKLKLFVRSSTR